MLAWPITLREKLLARRKMVREEIHLRRQRERDREFTREMLPMEWEYVPNTVQQQLDRMDHLLKIKADVYRKIYKS